VSTQCLTREPSSIIIVRRTVAERYLAIIRGERRGVGASLLRGVLYLASGPYAVVSRVRNRLYDRGWYHTFRSGVPVISVGNLTLGGTGKTPCVEYIARQLTELGRRPVILSRGYGNEQTDGTQNDEAMVLEDNLPDVPHLQSPDRVAIAMIAFEELEAEVLILDDGFQHRRMQRDLDIVLVDSTWPLAREASFPRGTLRESIRSLQRAHVIVLTRCDLGDAIEEQVAWLRQRAPHALVVRAIHEPQELVSDDGETESLESLRSQPIGAFCGIATPNSFRTMLTRLGAEPTAFRSFADHHPYCRADVADLEAWANQLPSDAIIVTTQKDWVKLRVKDLGGRRLWALRIGFRIVDGETEFLSKLRAAVPDELYPAEPDFDDS
jgi:tetraacyldisaccharide 4'-kinase